MFKRDGQDSSLQDLSASLIKSWYCKWLRQQSFSLYQTSFSSESLLWQGRECGELGQRVGEWRGNKDHLWKCGFHGVSSGCALGEVASLHSNHALPTLVSQ